MAKYYVQSGSVRGIVDSYDEECAAVWAVNLVMRQMNSGDDQLTKGDAMHMLDETIRISEQGFDNCDCLVVDSFAAFVQWHQLSRSIESLQQKLDEQMDDLL